MPGTPLAATVTMTSDASFGCVLILVINRCGISEFARLPDQVTPASQTAEDFSHRGRDEEHVRIRRCTLDGGNGGAVERWRHRLPGPAVIVGLPERDWFPAKASSRLFAALARFRAQHSARSSAFRSVINFGEIETAFHPASCLPAAQGSPAGGDRRPDPCVEPKTCSASAGSNSIHPPSPASTRVNSPSGGTGPPRVAGTPAMKVPLSCVPPPKIREFEEATSAA